MVKLTEVEDEHFSGKPSTTTDEALLAEDDEDYTDTGTLSNRGTLNVVFRVIGPVLTSVPVPDGTPLTGYWTTCGVQVCKPGDR